VKRAPRTPRAAPIPFPELPDLDLVPRNVFWRAVWLRSLAELTALHRFIERRSTRKESLPLRYALYGAETALRQEVANDFKTLVESGGLLYAWVPDSSTGNASPATP
jgi:hypothetical protein